MNDSQAKVFYGLIEVFVGLRQDSGLHTREECHWDADDDAAWPWVPSVQDSTYQSASKRLYGWRSLDAILAIRGFPGRSDKDEANPPKNCSRASDVNLVKALSSRI